MARRTHITELGCIACEELTEFGAGKEGWLAEDPNLLSALDTHSLALANRSLILIFDWNNNNNHEYDRNRPIKIKPSLSSTVEGAISAIEWLVFDDIRVICVGTYNGYFLVYSLDGDLIHKQIVHPGRILRLRIRGTKNSLRHDDLSSDEVCVIMPGVLARFDGSDLQSLLQRWFQERTSALWGQKLDKRESDDLQNSYGRLPYQLWNVNKYGSCFDAAITGIIPPPLLELQLLLLLDSQVNDTIVQLLLEGMLLFQHIGFRWIEKDL